MALSFYVNGSKVSAVVKKKYKSSNGYQGTYNIAYNGYLV